MTRFQGLIRLRDLYYTDDPSRAEEDEGQIGRGKGTSISAIPEDNEMALFPFNINTLIYTS